MKPVTVRRETRPEDRRRLAVAHERVTRHMAGMLDGLDTETRIETCRAAIRALSQAARDVGGEGRASGVLCGALANVSPGFKAASPARTEAEALFAKESSK